MHATTTTRPPGLLVGLGCAAIAAYLLAPAPEPTPAEPQFICATLEVAPAPPTVALPAPRVVVADLLSRGASMPGCGTFLVETTMVFSDITADNATLRVLVPCAELARPMYGAAAGNAPVLVEGTRYRLELSAAVVDDTAGKNDPLWRADRIDTVPARPPVADMMCRDVWGPSCR
jgi:hypothetical protein